MIRRYFVVAFALSLCAAGAVPQPMQPPPVYNVVTLEASATAERGAAADAAEARAPALPAATRTKAAARR